MLPLSTEIFWLTLTILITAILWVPYILNRMYEHGIWPALYNPQPDTRPKAQWAERMMRAHANAIENLIIFSPLVLSIEILKLNTHITATICAAYFFTRCAHVILYTFKVPFFRTIAFLIGVICQVMLIAIILFRLI
jgi:uncharacterized MAPEG superfamily protein